MYLAVVSGEHPKGEALERPAGIAACGRRNAAEERAWYGVVGNGADEHGAVVWLGRAVRLWFCFSAVQGSFHY